MKKQMISLALMLSVALFQTSCATKTGSGAAIGTGGGALAGAGIGALIGGKKGAAIGAAIGAVAGGATGIAVGQYMDKQEAKLKAEVKNANIERVGNDLVVRFSSGILFDSGKADLKSASQADLTEFAKILATYPATSLVVEGHTDSTGSDAINKAISQSRAQSVSSYLGANGVANARVSTVGLGENQPVADNKTAAGRASNRRVVVKIIPDAEAIEKLKS